MPTARNAKSTGSASGNGLALQNLEEYLQGLDTTALVAIVMQQAAVDKSFHRSLLLRMETAGGNAAKALRREITRATTVANTIDYHAGRKLDKALRAVIAPVIDIVEEENPAPAVGLLEHAIMRLDRALLSVDDSSGRLGGLLHELQALHLRACEKAFPPPRELAELLVRWSLESNWEAFREAYGTSSSGVGTWGGII